MTKRILLLLICALAAQARPAVASDHKPFLSMKPADLIACMPAAPLGWTMLSSLGSSDFTSAWVTAYGDRNFKQNPPPPVPGQPAPAVPPPPATMNVHITDTGYKDDFTTMVMPPKSGAPENTTYLQINNFPARMLKIDDKTFILDFLVKDRFLVEIRTANLEDDKLKKIVEAFDFTKLLAVPDTGATSVPSPVVLYHVDEMNPQNTHSYPLFWSVAPVRK